MEIDRDNLRELVTSFLQMIHKMEEELTAHELLVRWSRRVPGTADGMDRLLDHARKSMALPEHLQQEYDEQLGNIADGLVEALEIQTEAKKLENLQNMVVRRDQFVN
jgi:hypothetical protein